MRGFFIQCVFRARGLVFDCRQALALFAAALVPAAAGGYALFGALYRDGIADRLARLSGAAAAQGGVGVMLFSAAVPALLYGAAMSVCALSPCLLPLWFAAVFCYAGGAGVSLGFGAALWSAGMRRACLLMSLVPTLAPAPLYALLALLPIRSLQTRGVKSEEERIRSHVIRCFAAATALAALSSLLAAAGGAYALGRLLEGGA